MFAQSWMGAGEVACCMLMSGREGKGAERGEDEVVPGWHRGLELGRSASANVNGVCAS